MGILAIEAANAARELIAVARLKRNDIVVIGCSSSEISGVSIGKGSDFETAREVFDALYAVFRESGIYIAAQCCEHLNRAIVVEKDAVPGIPVVNVVPAIKAGGSFAVCAYRSFENPVVTEGIKADAGIDIGGTLIGMHLKEVAVPLRLTVKYIGKASVSAARTRPKFIGGQRALYDPELM